MNALDFILLIPLLFMAYRSFSKGLIISLATLAALVLGIWAGIRFSGMASTWVGQVIHTDEKFLPAITFIVIFILVLVIVHLFGKMLEKLVDLIALGWINKLLGGLFGIFKAVLLLSVLLYLISIFDPHEKLITPKTKENSFLYKPVASLVPLLLPFFDLDKLQMNHNRVKDLITSSGTSEAISKFQALKSKQIPGSKFPTLVDLEFECCDLLGIWILEYGIYSPIAATPGSTFPSIYSSIAPPPVET